mmetsp:Transcript_34919/g.76997  ORF Transcript_34919/g.76997 Transcript_34919/m.76997 type:complete len:218 (+) Transcript_34919:91-744(+)
MWRNRPRRRASETQPASTRSCLPSWRSSGARRWRHAFWLPARHGPRSLPLRCCRPPRGPLQRPRRCWASSRTARGLAARPEALWTRPSRRWSGPPWTCGSTSRPTWLRPSPAPRTLLATEGTRKSAWQPTCSSWRRQRRLCCWRPCCCWRSLVLPPPPRRLSELPACAAAWCTTWAASWTRRSATSPPPPRAFCRQWLFRRPQRACRCAGRGYSASR